MTVCGCGCWYLRVVVVLGFRLVCCFLVDRLSRFVGWRNSHSDALGVAFWWWFWVFLVVSFWSGVRWWFGFWWFVPLSELVFWVLFWLGFWVASLFCDCCGLLILV